MRIAFSPIAWIEHEKLLANIEHCNSLNLHRLERIQPHSRRLAIVGGGPSVLSTVEEIQCYSDILAVNGACKWLRDRGIDSTFLSLDPSPKVAEWALGAKKALLSTRADPSVFEVLKDADVTVFDIRNDVEDGICTGTSTATAGFHLAPMLGFYDVTWYGCEGSFPTGAGIPGVQGGTTHAYQNEDRPASFVLRCNGEDFYTTPDFYLQSTELAAFMRKFPKHYHERSGGLLAAMVKDPEHDVVSVSRHLLENLTPVFKEEACSPSA